jgi:hypothetical protein
MTKKFPRHQIGNAISGGAAYLVKSKSANWKGIFEFEGEALDAVNHKAAPKDVELFALDIRQPVDCRRCLSQNDCKFIAVSAQSCVNGNMFRASQIVQFYRKSP